MKVLKWLFPHKKFSHDVKFEALCAAVNLELAVSHRRSSLFKNASAVVQFILGIESFSSDEMRKAIKESRIFKIDSVVWNHCEKAVDHDKVFEIVGLFKDYFVIPSGFRLLLLQEAVTRNLLKFVEWQLPFINEEEIIEICDFAGGKNTPALELILTKIISLPEALRIKLFGLALKRFKYDVAKRINLLAPISKEGFLKLKKMIDSEIQKDQRLLAYKVLTECAKKHMKN